MGGIIQILQYLVGIVALVCWIMVVVKMFQKGQTVLGIVCIVLCGIGALIAFIYGWVKNKEWGITNIMIAWTACIVIGLVLGGVGFIVAPPHIQVGMTFASVLTLIGL